MKFKDLREDIFDIQAAKKIHWLYRGDDYISYLNLKFAPEKIEDIVFSMEDLVKPISLTSEDAEIGSRWKLHIPAYMTQQFTIKQHDFTITIKLVEGEEITLFKGIVNVNKRIFSKAVDDELASTVKTEEDPTEEDNNYPIGTHWVNTDTEVVYVLVKVDDGIAVWKDVTNQSVIDYIGEEVIEKIEELVFAFENVTNDDDGDISVLLKSKQDITFIGNLDSLTIRIPEDCEHGYFSGVNFMTGIEELPIIINNESSFPLKIIRYNIEIQEIQVSPNKTVNMSCYCDGLNIYCQYVEV